MAILKSKDARKMRKEELEEKLKDLKFELTKAAVTANKSGAKTKEIRKTIARIITISKAKEGGVQKK